MQFRTVTYNDLKEIGNLQPEDWPDIVPEFECYIRKEFCHPIKATIENKIVGLGTLIIFDKTCWLAHIIVHKDYRNRGIGFQITGLLLNNQKENVVSTFLLIATELGLPIYKKAGFRIVTEYHYLKRVKPWRDRPIAPNIFPYKNEFFPIILELDKKISGENRRSLLVDYLENTLVYIENNSIKGFYMPDLGEGLILAETNNAGIELMTIKYSKVNKAVLPCDNHAAIDFLKQNGFIVTDTRGTRMIRGKGIDWKSQQIFSRIGGNYG